MKARDALKKVRETLGVVGSHCKEKGVRLALIEGAFLILAASFFFVDAGRGLIEIWQSPEYNYGVLVPFISLYLGIHYFRTKRPEIRPSYLGVFIVFVSLFMSVFGVLAANNWINQFSPVVMIGGVLIALLGVPAFKAVFPAYFFLFFAVPLPPLILAGLTAHLQLISSTLSVAGLSLLGVSVFQEGNIIDLGMYKLQVAEACSGLRYLFPLLCFGYLAAIVFEKTLWKKIVLFFSTVPITIAINAIRIVIVGVSVNLWGIKMAEEGFLHEFEGWIMFIGGLVFFFFLSWMLSFIKTKESIPTSDPGASISYRAHLPRAQKLLGVLLILLVLGLIGQKAALAEHKDVLPPRSSFAEFPLRIAAWHGRTNSISSENLKALNLSDYFLADYEAEKISKSVNFYVAYYESQRHNAAPHSPLVCIPGSGWEVVSLISDYPVKDIQGNTLLKVNRAIIKNGQTTRLVYFWYKERGRYLTSTIDRKWYLFRDSLSKGRTDGALVRVDTGMDDDHETEADTILASFLDNALPLLKNYVPD
ncbi:MAG: VPLPA-CTERM-specific exosortase XrtD [Bdellovibrionales bacterium]